MSGEIVRTDTECGVTVHWKWIPDDIATEKARRLASIVAKALERKERERSGAETVTLAN
ncbi:hypothetical protein LJC71_04805 [Desulfosarcina sp. OttesenSCG-928-A07]|nr:hypothetical protein [Desulfosarcina sp. OttesenSCG-928-G17]MDL2329057.1 hypothetical protein [Desulfosarcina sp. OttesenSCG-928-A07]